MDWFARPVLQVTDVEASLRSYLDRLGFTSPWHFNPDGNQLFFNYAAETAF